MIQELLPPRTTRTLSLLAISLVFLAFNTFVLSEKAQAQETVSPTISEEEITENLKERLMNVIKEKELEATKRKAWVGTLSSIANETLTIETRSGPKLASTSAETTFVRSDNRAKLKLEDLSLGAKTIAMGYIDDKQVLNTYRVVIDNEVEEEKNESTKRSANFVTIENFIAKTDTVELKFQSQEIIPVEIGKNTEITITINNQVVDSDEEALKSGSQAVAIMETVTEDETITHSLLRIHILEDSSPEVGIEIGAETTIATSSSQPSQ